MTSSTVDLNWTELRRRSLQPGGFGAERVSIWLQLLHVDECTESTDNTEHEQPAGALVTSSFAHPDEHQIGLDTDRSFVLYPVDDDSLDHERHALQGSLNHLLVSLFRKRPRLGYFQGFHDIITVLFLTLPEDKQLACAEAISLQRLRDAMGKTLEPVVGLLYVLKKLIRLSDPEYAATIEESSPIPYFALSNLLTLFSHDTPTLPLIQHIFDFLLCRPPIASVYLAAAIALSRRQEVHQLQEQYEDGMVHSLLSGLPTIYDDDDDPLKDVTSDDATRALAAPDVREATAEDSRAKRPGEHAGSAVAETEPSLMAELGNIPLYVPPSEKSAEPLLAQSRPKRPRVALPSLLAHAEQLYARYPPSTSGLCLTEIFGPNSVMLTWSEDPAAMPSADEAEAMVDKPDLIALGYTEPIVPTEEDEGHVEKPHHQAHRPHRRRLRKRGLTLERSMVIATAVLVVGVAIAYNSRSSEREWRKLGRWIAKGVVGTSERLIDSLL